MLYLAEVQKQKVGLLSISSNPKTELKLLACQRGDQNWSIVSEEVIPTDEANKLNDGALVLVEVNPNRQVQRIQQAGRPLVSILQNLSRQLEKYKTKEDEIDQWKQSLTLQAQEFNRREMEMESRLEQLQEMEDEFNRLELQKQEFEVSRGEIERLQAEIERNHKELENAWKHLHGEQRRIEEFKADNNISGMILDFAQNQKLTELLNRLSSSVAPIGTVRENLYLGFELLERQQASLNPHWQQMEIQRTLAGQKQEEADNLAQIWRYRQEQYQQTQTSLNQQTTQLHLHKAKLTSKQEYARAIRGQLRNQENLYLQIDSLAVLSSYEISNQEVDIEALEKMPLEELQKVVQDLQDKLAIDSSFVHDQEQELNHRQQTIEELQRKIAQVSDPERKDLELELADEQDSYEMANQSLVGQRQIMLERQKCFKQHEIILKRRQGQTLANQLASHIDLSPVLLQVENQRQQLTQELRKLEREIEQIQAGFDIDQGMISHQSNQLEEQRQELKTIEENLITLRTATAEAWSRVNFYQDTLRPIQDSLDSLRHTLNLASESLARVQETGDYQLHTLNEIRQVIEEFTPQPELLV